MSRRSDQLRAKREEFFGPDSQPPVVLPLPHDGEEENAEENPNEAETRKLLVLGENHPGSIGLPVISATCQSTFPEEKARGSSSSLKNPKTDFPNSLYFYELATKTHPNSVPNAFLTLTLVLFNLLWSVGLTYWHFQLNNFDVAVASLVIIALSGGITSVAFFFLGGGRSTTRSGPPTVTCCARKELWRCSKLAWLLCAVPCLVPVILAGAYFLSSVLYSGAQWRSSTNSADSSTTAIAGGKGDVKSQASSSAPTAYRWLAASGSFFLVESLTLCFPFYVLHLTLLMEQPASLPSLLGCYTLLGLFLLSFSITFSRFQYDCLLKPDRFGEGTEKYLRFCYLWSAKIIWLVTFAILIVTARLVYPGREIEATAGAVAALTAIHEIPLWMCLLPRCGKIAAKLSGLFFLIPQFTALISLICWVNTDPNIYHTNIGSIVLGLYFWSEAVMLCGWLVDGNADKDIDLVPLYPHFFGDLIASCYSVQEGNMPSSSAVP